MGKIIKNGIEYGGGNDEIPSASEIPYDSNTTVKEKIDEIDDNLIIYEDVSVTTGSSQYVGYYYGDGSIATNINEYDVVGAFIYSSDSNRPAIPQRISARGFRAYCPVTNTNIIIRVMLRKIS